MLFLWDGYIANHPETVDWEGGLQEALPFVDHYRNNHGWNIQVIGVGAAIDNTLAFQSNPQLLVDDDHHPNCMASNLIAHMMEYAIYNNLAAESCSDVTNMTTISTNSFSGSSIPRDDYADLSEQWVRDVWKLLLSTNTVVGSHTSWQPKLYGHSNLHIKNLQEFEHREVLQGKAASGRADRKLSYSIPECSNNNLTIILEEGDLEWLGFGGDKLYLVKLIINDKIITWRSHPDFANRLELLDIQRWVHVGQALLAWASVYHVSLCQKKKHASGRKGLVNKIVGIMRPPIEAYAAIP